MIEDFVVKVLILKGFLCENGFVVFYSVLYLFLSVFKCGGFVKLF